MFAILIAAAMVFTAFSFISQPAKAATPSKYKTYTISAKSGPINKKMRRYSFYNRYTKHYYVLRSYMELFEKKGGGTLILKKGTYTITNTIFIPNNVTIILKKGAKIVKGKKTKLKKLKPSDSLFHFIKPSKGLKKKVYGKYNSSRNIRLIGEDKNVIDMKYQKNSNCIEAGHNKNVTIEGLTFKNVHGGHFMELDANYNCTIKNCTFLNIKDAKNVREAINLDTPDKITGGFTAKWSKMDKTANDTVIIDNCVFKNMPRAIGTHNYSYDHPHKNITITNCSISNVSSFGIGIMYWHGALIENNTIIGKYSKGNNVFDGILGYGAIGNTIKNNTIRNFRYPLLFKGYQDEHFKKWYKPIYNTFTGEELKEMYSNNCAGLAYDIGFIIDNPGGTPTGPYRIPITLIN